MREHSERFLERVRQTLFPTHIIVPDGTKRMTFKLGRFGFLISGHFYEDLAPASQVPEACSAHTAEAGATGSVRKERVEGEGASQSAEETGEAAMKRLWRWIVDRIPVAEVWFSSSRMNAERAALHVRGYRLAFTDNIHGFECYAPRPLHWLIGAELAVAARVRRGETAKITNDVADSLEDGHELASVRDVCMNYNDGYMQALVDMRLLPDTAPGATTTLDALRAGRVRVGPATRYAGGYNKIGLLFTE